MLDLALTITNGFGVSVVGIVPFRGTYFGVNDTLVSINPYQKDKGLVGRPGRLDNIFNAAVVSAHAAKHAVDVAPHDDF